MKGEKLSDQIVLQEMAAFENFGKEIQAAISAGSTCSGVKMALESLPRNSLSMAESKKRERPMVPPVLPRWNGCCSRFSDSARRREMAASFSAAAFRSD